MLLLLRNLIHRVTANRGAGKDASRYETGSVRSKQRSHEPRYNLKAVLQTKKLHWKRECISAGWIVRSVARCFVCSGHTAIIAIERRSARSTLPLILQELLRTSSSPGHKRTGQWSRK